MLSSLSFWPVKKRSGRRPERGRIGPGQAVPAPERAEKRGNPLPETEPDGENRQKEPNRQKYSLFGRILKFIYIY